MLCSLAIFLIIGCEGNIQVSTKPDPHRMELDSNSRYWDQNYKVYTLEGCEYIVGGIGKSSWGSHKGNCKNPIHNQTNK
jgi:hypothetical protein